MALADVYLLGVNLGSHAREEGRKCYITQCQLNREKQMSNQVGESNESSFPRMYYSYITCVVIAARTPIRQMPRILFGRTLAS
jgi:hypothetical protein